jgi:TolB-like protein/Flp pilus assembly protein TadD
VNIPAESATHLELEIGHVLFMDVVGYSKLLTNEQKDVQRQLTQIVRSTEHFRAAEAAGKLIRLPVGDGMALVFFNSPEAPVQCALEITEALKAYPQLKLRMGIHSGPVSGVTDVNDRSNIAGSGINMAQRIMACGDAGHILLSKRVAEDLAQDPWWHPYLHDLGECATKHGMSLVNLYTDKVGNPQLPENIKFSRQEQAAAAAASRPPPSVRRRNVIIAAAVLLAAALALFIYGRRPFGSSARELVPQKSIAVLPLENLSEEKENAYFADGIQDELLSNLSKIKDLKVISRTSVMQYKSGITRSLKEIAQQLGVSNIVEGSVRRSGNHVRVSVQLIDAKTDRHIWVQNYDRMLADSLTLQGELATQIATALKAKLAPEEKARLDAKPTANPEAYALYLTALGTGNDIEAEQLYMQATALDPGFALAYARASILNSTISTAMTVDHRARKAKARVQAEEALRLSPNLGEAHMALGLCLYWGDKNYNAALKEFEVAAAASPNNAKIYDYVAGIYRRQGRWRESVASFERAMSLDPRNRGLVFNAGNNYLFMRDWPAATDCYNRALEIAPDFVRPKVGLAYLEVFRNSNPAAGRKILQNVPEIASPYGSVTLGRLDLAMLERDYTAAEKVLTDCPKDFPDPGDAPKPFYQGLIAFARGDIESAQRYFAAARPISEERVRDDPDVAQRHAQLGLLYAYMQMKEDAIRESCRAVELEPESQDAFHGALCAANLALVYALVGEPDQAITLIERLLSTAGAVSYPDYPSSITLAELRLRREWDPLRSDPRFQKILAVPEPKTIY